MKISTNTGIILTIISILSLYSCSPRVITQISKVYPEKTDLNKIKVYTPEDTIPNTAEIIGSVAVLDRGTTTKCKYDQVVHLAKIETAKAGGNALAITGHQLPSFRAGSCHQISGNILLLSDTVINKNVPNPYLIAREKENERRVKMNVPTHTFHLGIGYSGITSKFYLPAEAKGDVRSGLDWTMGYDWVSKKNLGCGFIYSGYQSAYSDHNMDYDVYLHYIAPEFINKVHINEKWMALFTCGLGYLGYFEESNNLSMYVGGVGTHFNMGCEYAISKNFGVGANLGYIRGFFSKNDFPDLGTNEYPGINRINFNVGIRYYIK